jgi:hypothetical protein
VWEFIACPAELAVRRPQRSDVFGHSRADTKTS